MGFDETPHFEVNEETILYLNKTMQAYETRKKEQKIIADQMSQETKEFIADSRLLESRTVDLSDVIQNCLITQVNKKHFLSKGKGC